jgi:Zn-dependent peptidase ImmA (M78 family)/transcriptional regulator with XRE-family HTH domain
MSPSYAHINPEMLKWARNALKLSIPLAAAKICVSPEKLESWENGNDLPSINHLYTISKVYKRPFALFYFSEPPKQFRPLKDFRRFPTPFKISENDEYILQKELLLFQRKREMALDLYEQQETPPKSFTLRGSVNDTTPSLANKIIDYFKIDHNKISHLVPGYETLNFWKRLLESNGLLIFQTSGVSLPIMRGACISSDILPVIIINSYDTENGRIFSLFHELVHIILNEEGISNFRYHSQESFDPIEVFCNQVSAEVLVPSKLLNNHPIVLYHDQKDYSWTNKELTRLSQLFCVSQEVILRRLLSLGRTSNSFYQEFRENQVLPLKKKQTGGNYYRNIIAKNGGLFLNLALEGYYQNKISASSLSDYIQMKVSNLSKLEHLLSAKI